MRPRTARALCLILAAATLPCGDGKGTDMDRVKEWFNHGSISSVEKAAAHDSRGESAGQGECDAIIQRPIRTSYRVCVVPAFYSVDIR